MTSISKQTTQQANHTQSAKERNHKSGRLTLDDIRAVPGNEILSDKEAMKILLVLRQYCSLLYDCFTHQKHKDDEQP